jgi:hypothetical protein
MDFSKLSAADKRILIAAALVVVGGIVSIVDNWGVGGIVGGLAGLGAAFVVLQPQVAPTMQIPTPKPTLLLVLGAVAALGFVVSALQWYDDLLRVTRVFNLLFDIGLVAAIALAYFAWAGYKAVTPASTSATTTTPATPPENPPPA